MDNKARTVQKTLASLCVQACDGGCIRRTGAEASAEDVQVFSGETGLLLQLTLGEKQRERDCEKREKRR